MLSVSFHAQKAQRLQHSMTAASGVDSVTFCLFKLTGKVLEPVQSMLTLTASPSMYSCTMKDSLASSASIFSIAPSTCDASLTMLMPLQPTPSTGLNTTGNSNLFMMASFNVLGYVDADRFRSF